MYFMMEAIRGCCIMIINMVEANKMNHSSCAIIEAVIAATEVIIEVANNNNAITIIPSRWTHVHNIDSLLFSFPISRESLRLTHGARKSFVLAFSQDLGSGVRLVNVEWRYDHDIDLLDPLKVCVLLLCSDSVYMQNVSITSISLQSSRRIFIPNKSSAINSSGALTTTAAAGSSKSSLML